MDPVQISFSAAILVLALFVMLIRSHHSRGELSAKERRNGEVKAVGDTQTALKNFFKLMRKADRINAQINNHKVSDKPDIGDMNTRDITNGIQVIGTIRGFTYRADLYLIVLGQGQPRSTVMFYGRNVHGELMSEPSVTIDLTHEPTLGDLDEIETFMRRESLNKRPRSGSSEPPVEAGKRGLFGR